MSETATEDSPPVTAESPQPEPSPPPAAETSKVIVQLNATPNVVQLKKKMFAVKGDTPVGSLVAKVKGFLKMSEGEQLFLYVNQAFSPSPDQLIENLYRCFGTDNRLVLHYALTPAWG